MPATAEQATLFDVEPDGPSDPFRGVCPRCGGDVLAVEVDGREAVVEVLEVVPEAPCPQCAQINGLGHARRSRCPRCGDVGTIGEPLPLRGVAVDSTGAGRAYSRHDDIGDDGRLDDEAVHCFHNCL